MSLKRIVSLVLMFALVANIGVFANSVFTGVESNYHRIKDYEENMTNVEDNLGGYSEKIITSTGGFNVVWPTTSTNVTSPYGWRVRDGQQEFHVGIDIGGQIGNPIWSIASGTVVFVNNNVNVSSGYGA